VELAQGDPDELSTLVTQLGFAGLVDTLSAPDGKFTVFAPTNAAFAAYVTANGPLPTANCFAVPATVDPPAAAIAATCQPLINVLLYHVLGEERDAASFKAENSLTTLDNALTSTVTTPAPTVTITSLTDNVATVTTADLHATNGWVHIVNAVLVPTASNVLNTAAEIVA